MRKESNRTFALTFVCLAVCAGPGYAADPIAISAEGLPPRTLHQLSTSFEPVPWVQTGLRVAHLPPADWRQIAEYVKADYDVIAVNTLAQWDRVGPRAKDHPAKEVEEADAYLRRFVKMAHDGGAKAVFYLGPVQPALHNPVFREKHQDWMRINDDGTRATDYVNFRHPEVAAWLPEQFAFLAKEYQADGFWFDGYSPVALHTYDEATKKAFKEFSGADIPPKSRFDPRDPVARRYLQWHDTYFVEFVGRIKKAVRAANPGTVIYGNYSANRTWYEPGWPMGEYPATYATVLDLPSVELYWDNPGDALYQQFCYAFTQAASQDRGARVWVQPHAYGTLGTPTPVEILVRCIEGAPWGVYTEFVENAEREAYYLDYVNAVKAREEWWKQSEAVPFVGVVASEQTRLLMGRDTMEKYFSHTLGTFRAVFEEHLPVRMLTEYDLENANLHGVRVLMLPDVRVLSDRSSEVIRRFVKAGGGVVASGETSLYDDQLEKRPNFGLADLLKADFKSTKELTTREGAVGLWLAQPDHPILKDKEIYGQEKTAWRNPSGPPAERGWIEMIASTTFVQAVPGGNTLVLVSTNENKGNTTPALIASSTGQGRVVYMPAGMDQAMFYYPNAFAARMIVNAVKWAAGDAKAPVEVDGPLMLATTVRRQPAQKRTVVHLLNDHSSYGRHSIYQKLAQPNGSLLGQWPVRREIIPLHDIKVRCRVPGVTKATQQPENRALPLRQTGEGVEVTVPKLDMYSLVVFE